ncbi:PNGase F N-terminal domain-containing protein [Chitinophaga sancti]|uniref:PNGase F N-terminal domain-containing protein n=1 Tax=Chitinophaga sancti TaxID=1004 RepID=UPI002A7633DB|nr:PNGase F N-terminal domain-containing protein [Chitinophaga sancti]WPQ64213.1 PNGase F N-terminal domain-containing protein [Chitinophaga sancti]
MKYLFIAASLLFAAEIHAQNALTVHYKVRYHGEEMKDAASTLFIDGKKTHAIKDTDAAAKEQQYIDYTENITMQVLRLEGRAVTFKKKIEDYEKPELLPDTATIAGYLCKKAKVIIRSNTVEVWYTNALNVKGSPALGVTPGLGLVLRTVRNGEMEVVATEVKKSKINPKDLNWPDATAMGTLVDQATYSREVIDSRYTTIPVFSKEQVSFGFDKPNPPADQRDVTYHYAGGTVVLKKVKLPKYEPGRQLFAELAQYSNGDAYDRTGSVFMIPVDKQRSFLNGLQNGVKDLPVYKEKYQGVVATDDYQPTLELLRFFTPFGIHHYNERSQIAGYNWADSAVFRQEITELQSRMEGDVWLGVFIGNYDKGGHIVSLRLKYFKGDDDGGLQTPDYLQPIFNTTNLMEMAGQEYGTMFDHDSLTVKVNIPEGVKNLQLRYITTGHGGWGNGDEFVPKLNEIFVDGKRVYHFVPWRTDCGTYRLLNPSSGNFSNGLSSSDLSRSNWCPGSLTPAVYIPLPDLAPGVHEFKVAIPLGKREGTAFSAWNVSGVLMGEKK